MVETSLRIIVSFLRLMLADLRPSFVGQVAPRMKSLEQRSRDFSTDDVRSVTKALALFLLPLGKKPPDTTLTIIHSDVSRCVSALRLINHSSLLHVLTCTVSRGDRLKRRTKTPSSKLLPSVITHSAFFSLPSHHSSFISRPLLSLKCI